MLNPQLQAAIAARIAEAMQDEEPSEIWQAIRECTQFEEVITKLVLDINEDKATDKALGMLIDQYTKRKQRIKARVERQRAFVLELMNTAGQRKLRLDVATVGVKTTPPKVVVTDAGLLPDDCVKKTPDITAIKERMKHGGVAGATLSNGGETIDIRGV